WLQSVEDPAGCFLATDPGLWVADYAVDLRPEDLTRLGLRRSEDAVVLALVSRHGERITANLRAPLVIDASSRRGLQLVSTGESPWGLRHDLAHVDAPALAGIA
ncbi:MAG: flagellar assembly protein FliW, partial [Phycisphaerales bacterium]